MPLRARLPPEVIEEIRARKARGDALKVICIDLGVGSETVRKYTERDHPRSPERVAALRAWSGAGGGSHPKEIGPETTEAIRAAWRAGRTVSEIAEAFGVAYQTVRKQVRGIEVVPPAAPSLLAP